MAGPASSSSVDEVRISGGGEEEREYSVEAIAASISDISASGVEGKDLTASNTLHERVRGDLVGRRLTLMGARIGGTKALQITKIAPLTGIFLSC